MSSDIAVGNGTWLAHAVADEQRMPPAAAAGAWERTAAGVSGTWDRVPPRWRLVGVALIGTGFAAAIAAVTAANPRASPQHWAVVLRVLIILTLIGSGVYAQTSRIQARMGGLLIAAGLYA